MVRRILAAVDTSARAKGVVLAAANLAKQFGANLIVFRAINIPPEFPPAAATAQGDPLGPKLIIDAERELAELTTLAKSLGVDATTRVVASPEPWRAIVETADASAVDAIVVGSHGYKVLDRIFGTNAARVADRAHCLVVVVHETEPQSGAGPYRTIS